MELKIDEESLSEAINDSAMKGVREAISSYEVSSAIAGVVSKSLINGAISKAINKSIDMIDTELLSQKLAEELQRSTVAATTSFLQEGIVSVICKMRGIGDFSGKDIAERERIREEIFKKEKS